jgi:hypothetical protein
MAAKVIPSDNMGNCCINPTPAGFRLRIQRDREENTGLLGPTPTNKGMLRTNRIESGQLDVDCSIAFAEEEGRQLSDTRRAKILEGNSDPFAMEISGRQDRQKSYWRPDYQSTGDVQLISLLK